MSKYVSLCDNIACGQHVLTSTSVGGRPSAQCSGDVGPADESVPPDTGTSGSQRISSRAPRTTGTPTCSENNNVPNIFESVANDGYFIVMSWVQIHSIV